MQALASRALAAAIVLALSGNAVAQVVVSQVYSGADIGTDGCVADFIELHNNSDAVVTKHGFACGEQLKF